MKVFAHRGASGHEPENTLLAIQTALDMKVDGIEVDVHFADGELWVIHDRWLHKTTNGYGRISEKCKEEIRRLDAGKGQGVPTLEEVIRLVDGQAMLNIELKSERTVEPVTKQIMQAISKGSFELEQFIVSSFNHHLLRDIKNAIKQLRVGALIACRPLLYSEFAVALDAYSIHVDVDFINQAFVADAHQRGFKMLAYTVDEEADIEDLAAMGVDGIFSNYPTRSLVKLAHITQPGAPDRDSAVEYM